MTDTNNNADEPSLDDLANAAEQEARAASDAGDQAPDNPQGRLRQQLAEAQSRLARVQADFANSRRRLEADSEQRLQYANSSLIKALLPVIDNFERALTVDTSKADTTSVLKGLQLVHDQMMDVLKKQHVEIIAPAEGEVFDPTRHEAVMQKDSDAHAEPRVLQTFQNGYALHGRTLRPASVVVSKSQ